MMRTETAYTDALEYVMAQGLTKREALVTLPPEPSQPKLKTDEELRAWVQSQILDLTPEEKQNVQLFMGQALIESLMNGGDAITKIAPIYLEELAAK